MRLLEFCLIAILLLQCNHTPTTKTLVLNHQKVIGDISADTVFNGLIRFYNLKTGLLEQEAHYVNGILHGTVTNYYGNGKKHTVAPYKYGKNVGFNEGYDSLGRLERKTYMYDNLRVGPTIEYRNEKIKEYYFYSFDGELLYELNYDSLQKKRIIDISRDYFILKLLGSNSSIDGNVETEGLKTFLIYLLNVP